MPRALGASLKARLALGSTTLSRIWKITLKDGVIFRFTDHDQPIIIAADGTYTPTAGIGAMSVFSTEGSGVQNTETIIVFDDTNGMSEADCIRGIYDDATVLHGIVDWTFPDYGTVILILGNFGNIELSHKGYAKFEIVGLLNSATRTLGESYTPECKADLGDTRCGVTLASFQQVATVATVATVSNFTATVGTTQVEHFYTLGHIEWLTGDNAGIAMEVLQDTVAGTTRTLFLTLAMPHVIQVGDTFTLTAGCDKMVATCGAKFSNADRFVGEPATPGADLANKYPIN